MLTCRELTELVTDYLEGRLRVVERLRFQLHLGMCRHCRAHLRQMRLTVRTLGALPAEPISADVRDELLSRFRSWRPRAAAAVSVPWSLRLLAALERVQPTGSMTTCPASSARKIRRRDAGRIYPPAYPASWIAAIVRSRVMLIPTR